MDNREHSYFRVERTRAKHAGIRWRAAATIFRKDTGEPVDYVSATGATAEAAEEQLSADVENRLALLGRPRDWGRDATVSRLLQQYLLMKDQLYGIVQRAEAASESEASRLRLDAQAYERAELQALKERLAALTEPQRLELATITEEQRARRQDARVLDLLTAKKHLVH